MAEGRITAGNCAQTDTGEEEEGDEGERENIYKKGAQRRLSPAVLSCRDTSDVLFQELLQPTGPEFRSWSQLKF